MPYEYLYPPSRKEPKEVVDPKTVGWHRLTHNEAALMLRPQHALVHASLQGRTMRNKHLAILDTFTTTFTVRHLIVAMSRATHGKFVHVFSPKQQHAFVETLGSLAAFKSGTK